MSDIPPPLQPEANQPSQPLPPQNAGSGKKWGIGCGLGCLALIVLAVVLAVVGVKFGKDVVAGFIGDYTAEAPVEIVAPVLDPVVVEDAIQRYDAFRSAMSEGEAPEPLLLTGDDVNAILANHPSFSAVADSIVVAIDDDQLTSQVSLKLDEMEIPVPFLAESMEGKYFNGELSLSLDTVAGRPAMFIEGLSVDGVPIPRQFIDALSKENLLKEVSGNSNMKAFFDRIEELKIEEGQLKVIPAAAP
ncbi:MAG: hypothetical protein P1U68_07910 [Verrucomicrobiales bacterium]|nr:hypothetical protein [Verrucomicrobiales bacterium]